MQEKEKEKEKGEIERTREEHDISFGHNIELLHLSHFFQPENLFSAMGYYDDEGNYHSFRRVRAGYSSTTV
jgi:hypothetical protein